MKPVACFLLFLFLYFTIKAQPSFNTEILTSQQVRSIFNDSIKKSLGLTYPIFRVYKYNDKSGSFLCALTESNDSTDAKKDTFHHSIKAVNIKVNPRALEKVWELNDNILSNHNQENSIWFWTKYSDFKDFDNDGIIEPIIIYGTSALNGYDDGRIKIIVYYKGQKFAIRHQNGILDNERKTQVDKAFYNLPKGIREAVKEKIQLMEKDGLAIFTTVL